MKILILVGSSDINSHSLSLGKAIKKGLEAEQAETELINLIEYDLPIYRRDDERSRDYNPKVNEFLEKSKNIDAVVWVTPDYHNSYSAVLKNALDWQHAFKFDGKVVGLASNGGGRSPQPVDHLMMVARSQGYIISTKRVCTDKTDYDDDLNIIDQTIQDRIISFCSMLVQLTNKISSHNGKYDE